MKLHFIKANPNDNMTVFITEPLDRRLHSKVAKEIISYGNLHAEQVGFLELPQSEEGKEKAVLRLQMMGGEFCGNAARALAAYLALNRFPGIRWDANTAIVPIEVSGMGGVVECSVEVHQGGIVFAYSQMPLPVGFYSSTINFKGEKKECTVVYLPGIVHVLVEGSGDWCDREELVSIAKELGLHSEAVGLNFCNFTEPAMNPVVWVLATDTIIAERGCGSGAVALASALALKDNFQGEKKYAIKQPGGVIEVIVGKDKGKIQSISIGGEVKIVAEGIVYLE